MEAQEPWLVCRRSGKVYLLAQDDRGYYAIEVGKRLDYATEEWLQQQGVTEELLKELHLPYHSYPKTGIRGVAIGGTLAGDMISLYPKSGNRRDYILELDYEEAFVEAFFAHIFRFQPPKKKVPKENDDWRKAKQDPELFNSLRFVPAICLVANVCAVCGYVMTGHWAWFTLCLSCLVIQFGLLLGMSPYFTIISAKKGQKSGAWELEIPLIVLAFGLFLRNDVNLLSEKAFWTIMAIGVIAGLVIYAFLTDAHKVKGAVLGAVLFGALAGWCILGQANQIYDFGEKDCYVLEVENLHSSSSRKSRNYYCGVTLPDGREVSLNIKRDFYNTLEEGDLVQVERGDGAFGMEYANAYPLDRR